MWTLIVTRSPRILAIASASIAAVAAAHAAMRKDQVLAAIGWVGVIPLSPFIGALLHVVASEPMAGIETFCSSGVASSATFIR